MTYADLLLITLTGVGCSLGLAFCIYSLSGRWRTSPSPLENLILCENSVKKARVFKFYIDNFLDYYNFKSLEPKLTTLLGAMRLCMENTAPTKDELRRNHLITELHGELGNYTYLMKHLSDTDIKDEDLLKVIAKHAFKAIEAYVVKDGALDFRKLCKASSKTSKYIESEGAYSFHWMEDRIKAIRDIEYPPYNLTSFYSNLEEFLGLCEGSPRFKGVKEDIYYLLLERQLEVNKFSIRGGCKDA